MVRASQGIEALELASDLLVEDRTEYLSTIMKSWVGFDAQGLLDTLGNASDPQVQSAAAVALKVRHNSTDILTDEQVE